MPHTFRLLIIILFFLSAMCSSAQVTGVIKDKKTGKPLEFVNIGIVGKNIGTVSDELGVFTLNTNLANESDTIKFFQLGYATVSESIKNFLLHYANDPVIYLRQTTTLLKETVVTPKKIVKKIIGNRDNTEAVIIYFTSNQLGSEIGVCMHLKNKFALLEELRFNIAEVPLDSTLFRINIYTVKNCIPDSNILAQPLYVTYINNSGPLLVNVKDLQLYVKDDFFVSVEWIKGSNQGGVRFCAGIINTHSLIRATSEGTWRKSPAGAGFSCKISYFK